MLLPSWDSGGLNELDAFYTSAKLVLLSYYKQRHDKAPLPSLLEMHHHALDNQEYLTILEHSRVLNYLRVAAFSSMIYDYMLTFDLEVKFIWSAPWGVVKILYLLTRYILFFNITFATAAQLASAESSPECKALHQANIVFAVSGMIASESLLTIRTWAVCGNRRWLGIVLSFCFSAFFCALVVTNAAVLSTFKFLMQDSPLRGLLHECLVTRQDAHLSVILGCLVLVYDAVNMGIIIMPAYYAIKQGSSNLVLVVLRDGLIYYVYIFIMSAASIAVFTKLTGHHTTLVTAFGHTLHAIFTCRVVLHAREEAWKTRMISAITLEHIDLEASK